MKTIVNTNKIDEYIHTPNTIGNYIYFGLQTLINLFRYNKFTDTLFMNFINVDAINWSLETIGELSN
jgi:hypothetical protein